MEFSIKDLFSKCEETADFVTFTEEIYNGKLLFFCAVYTDIWEIVLYLQVNPYRLITKNINSIVFISTIIK